MITGTLYFTDSIYILQIGKLRLSEVTNRNVEISARKWGNWPAESFQCTCWFHENCVLPTWKFQEFASLDKESVKILNCLSLLPCSQTHIALSSELATSSKWPGANISSQNHTHFRYLLLSIFSKPCVVLLFHILSSGRPESHSAGAHLGLQMCWLNQNSQTQQLPFKRKSITLQGKCNFSHCFI